MLSAALRLLGTLAFGALGLIVGAMSFDRPALAFAVALLPIVGVAALFPLPFLVAAVALLPLSTDIAGGRLGGLRVSPSDVLFGVGAFGLLARTLGRPEGNFRKSHALKPMFVPLAAYFCALVLAVVAHPSVDGLVVLVQRIELVIVALLAGGLIAEQGWLRSALGLQVVSASGLALVAVIVTVVGGTASGEFLGMQKNFAGQAIAGALIVLFAYRVVPARLVVLGILSAGLIASLSRGAIVAAGAGLLLIAVLQGSKHRLRLVGLTTCLVVLVWVTYSALPQDQQQRLFDVSPETDYGVEARVSYADDAWATFRSAPMLGIGPGNYAGGVLHPGITDPHNVLLLEAVDGGIVLSGAFIVLNVGAVIVLFRRRKRHPIVVAAIAVQVATVLHGLVDVYWVRGTPVLGWILVGAALTLAERERLKDATPPLPRPVAVEPR